MKQTRLLMGMPITVDILDSSVHREDLDQIFAFFVAVDERFSTYKATSEISHINRGELAVAHSSAQMQTVFALSEQTKKETYGYFNIQRDGLYDPSGIVKGWAIQNAAQMLKEQGFRHFYVEAGGDIQVADHKHGQLWRIGIRNPFNRAENVKVLALTERGIATSGTAIRGQHIYDPYRPERPILDIVSLTVIGPDIYEADRFATAAFAMGRKGIQFLEQVEGCEGYMIDAQARATLTSGLERHVLHES